MGYLFFHIWLWIIASFALGWFSHWFLCCRGKKHDDSDEGADSQEGSLENESMNL